MTNPVSVPRELLPCPFCGNDLQVSQHRYNPWARCITENCKGAQLPLLNIELPEDVERWNRRAAPVAAPSQDDVRDAERLDWLAEQLADINISGVDACEHATDDVEPWPVLWRRAIDAALAAHRAGKEKPEQPPANCRQRLMAEGKPYPRSSCEACGKFSPKWKECDAALSRQPNHDAPL